MTPITTIVRFQVPAENTDRFLAFWQDTVFDEVRSQPGLIDGCLYRGIDADGAFGFVNVARWQSAEHLSAALRASTEQLRRRGTELGTVLADLGVTVSQDNYVEAVRYTGTAERPPGS